MTEVNVPFSVADRAIYVQTAETLVVADPHLGRAAASSVDAPIDDGGDVRSRLEDALERFSPKTVVVAGDLLHAFSRVPRGVGETVETLVETVERTGAELVVTPGNHDSMLEAVYNGHTTPEYRLEDGETVVLHGHERPETTASRYVIGHVHPALSVGGRKRPCLLYGPGAHDGSDVVVVPAFTRIAPGATINGMSGEDVPTPLVEDVDAFHPALWDGQREELLWFPPLGKCRRFL